MIVLGLSIAIGRRPQSSALRAVALCFPVRLGAAYTLGIRAIARRTEEDSMRVDSHQHFWSLDDPWFCWPTPDLAAIRRSYGPEDLRPLIAEAGIDRTVLVQVAPVTSAGSMSLSVTPVASPVAEAALLTTI